MNAKERKEITRAGIGLGKANEEQEYWLGEFSGRGREWAIFTLSQGRYLGRVLGLDQKIVLERIARGNEI